MESQAKERSLKLKKVKVSIKEKKYVLKFIKKIKFAKKPIPANVTLVRKIGLFFSIVL